jgi:hypothetical protein
MSLREKILECSTSYSDSLKEIRDPKGASDSSYTVSNLTEQEYSLIKFDGCVFDKTVEKCDFGLRSNDAMHYVELKGIKNNKGLSQLLTTLSATEQVYEDVQKKVRLIVSREKAPRYLDQNTIRKIAVKVGSPLNDRSENFIIRTKNYTEKL